jgi:photosystem II stability/assembly factor-like uncharacterized protein
MRSLEPRALRALTLMAACSLALTTVAVVSLRADQSARRGPAGPTVHRLDLASDMDWISDREGWLSAFDRQAGTTTLFHTTDAGRHWTRQRVSKAQETVDFFDSLHGLLTSTGAPPGQSPGPGGPVTTYRSADGGRHWQRLELPRGAEARRPTFADARHGWVWDPAPAGLYSTGDGGAHWRRLDALGRPGPGSVLRPLGFRDGAHGWAAGAVGPLAPALYATGDGGEHWTALPLPAPDGGWPVGSQFDVGPLAISSDGQGQVMVSELVSWAFSQVAITHWVAATTDGGATWAAPQRLPGAPPGTVLRMTTSRADGSVSWAWSAGEVLMTRDGGGHWTAVTPPQDGSVDRLQAVDAETAWAAASVTDEQGNSRWTLFSTHDAGVSWIEATPPSLR